MSRWSQWLTRPEVRLGVALTWGHVILNELGPGRPQDWKWCWFVHKRQSNLTFDFVTCCDLTCYEAWSHFWFCDMPWPRIVHSELWSKRSLLCSDLFVSQALFGAAEKSFVSQLQTNRPCSASFRSSCLQALIYFARHLRTLSPICITELQAFAFRPCSALLWLFCVQALLWAAGERNSCTTEGTDRWTQPLWRGWSTTLCHTTRGQLPGQAFSAASE